MRLPPRVVDTNYTIFLMGLFLCFYVWVNRPVAVQQTTHPRFRTIESVALLTFALAMVTTGNARNAIGDLMHGRARQWHQNSLAWFQSARSAARMGVRDLVLPQPPKRPFLYRRFSFGGELSEDPKHWGNVHFARFFGVETVRLEPLAPDRSAEPSL